VVNYTREVLVPSRNIRHFRDRVGLCFPATKGASLPSCPACVRAFRAARL
jgi:hypothetical protein